MVNKKNTWRYTLKAAFPHTIPVLLGFLVLGIAYGLLMDSKGYGIMWSVPMSLLCFCGSMQFVAVSLLTTVFDPLQAFILSIMVNARHIFYGISLLEKYKGIGKIKSFLIFTLCDETYSIVSSVTPEEGINKKKFYFLISLLDYSYWSLGTLIGGLFGTLVNFNTEGIDFVLTALFVVLFMEQLKKKENIKFGIIGIICSLLALLIFGSENVVIPAMVFIMLVLIIWRKKEC